MWVCMLSSVDGSGAQGKPQSQYNVLGKSIPHLVVSFYLKMLFLSFVLS